MILAHLPEDGQQLLVDISSGRRGGLHVADLVELLDPGEVRPEHRGPCAQCVPSPFALRLLWRGAPVY